MSERGRGGEPSLLTAARALDRARMFGCLNRAFAAALVAWSAPPFIPITGIKRVTRVPFRGRAARR
eukprot:362183-Chlamydomonas_euryale.AAC.5